MNALERCARSEERVALLRGAGLHRSERALGALLAWVIQSRWRSLGERFTIAAAAGLVAGESVVGVGTSFWMMFAGG